VLFVGPPITLGESGANDRISALRQGYLDRLVDRYRVIVMDYPPTGTDAYRALEQWQDEAAIATFTSPRMAFAGRDDVITTGGVTTRIGPLLAERQTDLERLGWTVRLVDNFRHELLRGRTWWSLCCESSWIRACGGMKEGSFAAMIMRGETRFRKRHEIPRISTFLT
jgi:hypothetical protein